MNKNGFSISGLRDFTTSDNRTNTEVYMKTPFSYSGNKLNGFLVLSKNSMDRYVATSGEFYIVPHGEEDCKDWYGRFKNLEDGIHYGRKSMDLNTIRFKNENDDSYASLYDALFSIRDFSVDTVGQLDSESKASLYNTNCISNDLRAQQVEADCDF